MRVILPPLSLLGAPLSLNLSYVVAGFFAKNSFEVALLTPFIGVFMIISFIYVSFRFGWVK